MDPSDTEPTLLRVWPWLARLTIALAVLNLVAALVIRIGGAALHPMFADTHTWLLFLVTGLSLSAQAVMMAITLRVLRSEGARPGIRRRVAHRAVRMPPPSERHAARHRRVDCPFGFGRVASEPH